jgi:hypothetical protein
MAVAAASLVTPSQITINRPEKINASSNDEHSELRERIPFRNSVDPSKAGCLSSEELSPNSLLQLSETIFLVPMPEKRQLGCG